MKTGIGYLIIILSVLLFFACERNNMYEFANSAADSSDYSGPRFQTVGDSGKIYYSYDGQNWTEADSPTTMALYGIVYGDNKFVATGTMGIILTSTDGINWDITTLPGAVPLYCIAYGNGTYVAAGQWMSMNIQVRTSTDLITWDDHSINNPPGYTMNGITFGNGRFYMLGNNTSAWYSDDNGVTWISKPQTGTNYFGTVYANSKFTAVGAGGMIRESPDATVWSTANAGTYPAQIQAITYGNGKYVITGSSGDSAWSTSGTSWTLVNTGTANTLNAVTYGTGLYVAVGDAGTVSYSSDGLTWTSISISSSILRGIAYRP